MTKRITAAFLALLMLFLLSGCHGKRSGSAFTVPDHFDDKTPLEIVFWAKNDTNKNQVAVYQQAIDGFQALYPNVTVNMRLYTDYGRIYNDVITNISTNTTPNVCITYPDHIATYLTGSNTVAALDDLMKDARFGLGGSEVRFDAPKQRGPLRRTEDGGDRTGIPAGVPDRGAYLCDALYAVDRGPVHQRGSGEKAGL